MTVILFIIVLLVTVLVHEWGHYITAKKSGMLVEEFGFGIPPRIYAWKRGETTYSINAIPFGGFVKIAGENGIENTTPVDRQFESKPWYKQSLVLVAGVVCNILLAVLLFTISYTVGTQVIDPAGTPTVVHVTSGGAIEQSGIKIGDKIIQISKNGQTVESIETQNIKQFIGNSPAPIAFTYLRNKITTTVVVTPVEQQGSFFLGLGVEKVSIEKSSLVDAFSKAIRQTIAVTTSIFKTVGSLLTGLFNGEKQAGQLLGPIGLAKEVRSASAIGFAYLLSFTAMISINLAVINILPFPALDGGRLIIVILERIFNKKFSKKVVGMIHAGGFILLFGLMIVLSIGDIRRLF
jgi:regulator of sigma E protease